MDSCVHVLHAGRDNGCHRQPSRYISLDRISTSQAGTSVRSCAHHFVRANGATKWTGFHPDEDVRGKYHGCVEDNSAVGIAWGTTLDAITHYVVPKDVKGVSVVQMNGSANPASSGIPYVGSILSRMAAAFGGEVIHFPVPTFFDSASTKAAMWQERSVQAVLKAHRELDLAVFSVGALDSPVPSHVYSAGYMTDEEKANLVHAGVVGDVNTVFLKADGAYDVEFNKRATGLAPFQLQRIPRRLCVVAGRAKAVGLLAALRARVATDLVVDDATARAVLDLM